MWLLLGPTTTDQPIEMQQEMLHCRKSSILAQPRCIPLSTATLADGVLLLHVVACDSEGVVTFSAHVKLNVVPKCSLQ